MNIFWVVSIKHFSISEEEKEKKMFWSGSDENDWIQSACFDIFLIIFWDVIEPLDGSFLVGRKLYIDNSWKLATGLILEWRSWKVKFFIHLSLFYAKISKILFVSIWTHFLSLFNTLSERFLHILSQFNFKPFSIFSLGLFSLVFLKFSLLECQIRHKERFSPEFSF